MNSPNSILFSLYSLLILFFYFNVAKKLSSITDIAKISNNNGDDLCDSLNWTNSETHTRHIHAIHWMLNVDRSSNVNDRSKLHHQCHHNVFTTLTIIFAILIYKNSKNYTKKNKELFWKRNNEIFYWHFDVDFDSLSKFSNKNIKCKTNNIFEVFD